MEKLLPFCHCFAIRQSVIFDIQTESVCEKTNAIRNLHRFNYPFVFVYSVKQDFGSIPVCFSNAPFPILSGAEFCISSWLAYTFFRNYHSNRDSFLSN